MKFTIEGFSQKNALSMNLDVKDLVLLRWLLDFIHTNKMDELIFEGNKYYWLDYGYVTDQLPILGLNSQDVVARRMKRMARNNVLEQKPYFHKNGTRAYFRFKEEAIAALITSTPDHKLENPYKKGDDSKVGWVPTQRSGGCRPKSRVLYKDSSIIDSSINDKKTLPAAFSLKLDEALKKVDVHKFNVYQLLGKYKQLKHDQKLSIAVPEFVIINVIEAYLLQKDHIRSVWPWFLSMLDRELSRHCAEQNILDHDKIKNEPAAIGNIMATLADQAH